MLCILLLPVTAGASTGDAWQAFRAEVAKTCRALAETAPGQAVVVEVSEFGTERYGAAIVSVQNAEGSVQRMICVFDKATRSAELTGPL